MDVAEHPFSPSALALVVIFKVWLSSSLIKILLHFLATPAMKYSVNFFFLDQHAVAVFGQLLPWNTSFSSERLL